MSDHRMTFSRSFCKRETSFSQQIGFDTRVSSAKLLIIDSVMQRSISLINMRKRIGPNTMKARIYYSVCQIALPSSLKIIKEMKFGSQNL